MTNILLLGGTGLVGQAILHQVSLYQNSLHQCKAPVSLVLAGRRKVDVQPPHQSIQINFDSEDYSALGSSLHFDAAVCTLGTTLKQAGSKEAFRKVDHTYVLSIAKHLVDHGCKEFHYVSSLGADVSSVVFYSKVKGEVERDLAALGFERLFIYRPSMLLGDRKEPRLGEKLFTPLMKAVGALLPRTAFGNYAPIEASTVAQGILTRLGQPSPIGPIPSGNI